MTIRLTAYDTTVGSVLLKDSVKKELAQLYIRAVYEANNFTVQKDKTNIFYIDHKATKIMDDIPALIHPLLYIDDNQTKVLFSDVRMFINLKDSDRYDEMVATNPSELAFVTLRTDVNALWIDGEQDNIRRTLGLANKIYAGWISDTITKRFGLNPEEQLKIFVIAHYFYRTQFYARSEFSTDEKYEFSFHTIKDSKVSPKFVNDILEALGPMDSIVDFIEEVKRVIQSRRLTDLNLGTLITIMGTTWYGTNSKEILSVALEHPPTFTTLVAVSLTQRFYKKSAIHNISTKYCRSGDIQLYIDNLMKLVDTEE